MPVAHRFLKDQAVRSKLATIEKDFFTDSPLQAIKDYYSEVIAELPADDEKAYVQTYVNLVQARQYQRLGLFKEAYRIVESTKEQASPPPVDSVTECSKDVVLYLEWVLVAKKVYNKQMFQQKSLDLLLAALKYCVILLGKEVRNGHYVEYYHCKIHENLSLIYTDLFLYKSTKYQIEKSKEIRKKDEGRPEEQRVWRKLDSLKYSLKVANMYKRNGFYWKSRDQIEELEQIVQTWSEEELASSMDLTNFKFRVLRDKARVSSMLNNEEMAEKYFQQAEEVLGETKEENVKYARMLYIEGLASQKFSEKKAMEYYKQSQLFFNNILNADDGFYIAQNSFNIGSILKSEGKYDEAQKMYVRAGRFLLDYFDDELYGEFRGGKHPTMQQYFQIEYEWGTAAKNNAIESQMLKNYIENFENSNKIESEIAAERNKRSLFLMEPLFQKL